MSKNKKGKEIPHIGGPIVETHCHLDFLKEETIEEILKKSHEYGIDKVVTIAVNKDNLSIVRDIANKYSNVYCTQGIHPHNAKDWSKELEKTLIYNLKTKNQKTVAVGEIGLDYHYNNSPKENQIEAFERQIELATEFNLPVVIHSRDAEEDTKKILTSYSTNLQKKGVIHSFTSKMDLAEKALDSGFYLGFNGIITFNSATEVREVVKRCPLERILVETDSPFLTPTPFRGNENAPYYLPLVIKKIAEIKNVDIDLVIKTTTKNAFDLFSFPG